MFIVGKLQKATYSPSLTTSAYNYKYLPNIRFNLQFKLARHPDKQEKLRLELQQHLNAKADSIDFEELIKLPYLDQCLAGKQHLF